MTCGLVPEWLYLMNGDMIIAFPPLAQSVLCLPIPGPFCREVADDDNLLRSRALGIVARSVLNRKYRILLGLRGALRVIDKIGSFMPSISSCVCMKCNAFDAARGWDKELRAIGCNFMRTEAEKESLLLRLMLQAFPMQVTVMTVRSLA